jgi:Family of unknown function (DUF5990)/Domain of unknown function (DUF5655)
VPQLPDRPDLGQLRRQARELHRAAQGGDPVALRRLRPVSDKITLSTAQLALAREYGFPSWRRLRDEVEHRRTLSDGPGRMAPSDGPGRMAPEPVPAPPDDADELVNGQYADRPQLRPILDAVLAAMPLLGPVTLQARKSCVSLVSPRRTFAAVQATTKSRVDLGLRLDGMEPTGRLLRAKNIASGTINLRMALGRPEEVDEEVLGWLRRAYDESVAPPAPRRPPRRPAPVLGTLSVLIDGFDLPGLTCNPGPDLPVHRTVHVALSGHDQDRPHLDLPGRGGARAIEPVPGDAPSARWEVPVTVRRGDDGFDFGGPFVRGGRDDRHLGLAWGDVPGDGTLRLFRGAKLRLVDVEPGLIEAALRPRHRLVARIRLTDVKGNPVCARVHPPALTWSVEQCG